MRKSRRAQKNRLPSKPAKRKRIYHLPVPPELAAVRNGESVQIRVEVFADPSGPFTVEAGFGEDIPRGVYLAIRGAPDATHNAYGVIDSKRRQIASFHNVPEQPTGWSARNDRGEIHDAVRDLILCEAWRILSVRDSVFQTEEEKRKDNKPRAIYRGLFPYSQLSPMAIYANCSQRVIEEVRDCEVEDVRVALTATNWRQDTIDLEIGPSDNPFIYHKPALTYSENYGEGDRAVFRVRSISALEKLRDALDSAIDRAKQDGWPYSPAAG